MQRTQRFQLLAFSGDIVLVFKLWRVCVCVSECACVFFIIQKNNVNALKIVRSTEPQQIDKNTNGRMKMHYYYWVESICCYAFYLSLTVDNEQQQQQQQPMRTRTHSIQFCTLDILQ